MDIAKLKDTIIENPHYIEKILEDIGLFKIREYDGEYRCARNQDSSATGVCIRKDNLHFIYRGGGGEITGDIITMVREFKSLKFGDALKFICSSIGLEYESFNSSEEQGESLSPFGGYFIGIKSDDTYQSLKTYSEDILNENNFVKFISKRFEDDGISMKVQNEFGIRYDLLTERIVVPWRNPIGELIGLMGRYNGNDFEEVGLAKWYPIIKFSKSQVLYGYYENYDTIVRDGVIIITESEKGVMQLRSMERELLDKETGEIIYEGYNYGVAVGSHSISKVQTKLIQSCFPKEVIVAFDSDVDEEYLIEMCKKLQHTNRFHQMNISYIYDREGKYLSKESKLSPTDLGKEIFEKLIKECLHKV